MVVTRAGATKSVSHDGTHISEVGKEKGGKDARPKKSTSGSTSTSPLKHLLLDEETYSPCKVCTHPVGEEKGIKCDRCNAWVHLKCSDLDSGEYGLLARLHSLSVKWHCPVCTSELQKLPDPNDRLAAHEAKIDTMMGIVLTMQQQNAMIIKLLEQSDERMERKVEKQVKETFEEDREKEGRKNNLIMYNVKESRNTGDEAESEDYNEVFNVFQEVDKSLKDPQLGEAVVEVIRLGKRSEQATRPRPLKVVMKDNDVKMRLLRKARNLKKSVTYSSVGISADKTLKERNEEKLLIEERNRRREEGEEVVIYAGKVVTKESLDARKQKPEKDGATGFAGDFH